MKTKFISFTGDTLDEARQKFDKIRAGFKLIKEEIISDGKPKISKIRTEAETPDEAFQMAEKVIYSPTTSIEEKTILESFPEEKFILEDFDPQQIELKANEIAKNNYKRPIKKISLVLQGKKGFLGFGRTSNRYEVTIKGNTKVEIIYKYLYKATIHFWIEIAFESPNVKNLFNLVGGTNWDTLKLLEKKDSVDEEITEICKLFMVNEFERAAIHLIRERGNAQCLPALINAVHEGFNYGIMSAAVDAIEEILIRDNKNISNADLEIINNMKDTSGSYISQSDSSWDQGTSSMETLNMGHLRKLAADILAGR